MFLRLFGGRNAPQSVEENLPSIQVTRVVAIDDETKQLVRPLVMMKETIGEGDPHVASLKAISLRNEYHRAGGYLPVNNGQERASMWVQKDDNGMVVAETMVMLRERRGEGVYQPASVMYGPNAMFAMIFKPPCCTGIESLLAVFVARNGDGKPVPANKVVQSGEALKQGVADYFREVVKIGMADTDIARLQLDETYKHLMDIEHRCAVGAGFPSAYRNG